MGDQETVLSENPLIHWLDKGIAKVAKAIGISYAEACVSLCLKNAANQQTGFEFKKQRAIPVINGIVVAEENEDLVLEVSSYTCYLGQAPHLR